MLKSVFRFCRNNRYYLNKGSLRFKPELPGNALRNFRKSKLRCHHQSMRAIDEIVATHVNTPVIKTVFAVFENKEETAEKFVQTTRINMKTISQIPNGKKIIY